jgi:hypothetical protein
MLLLLLLELRMLLRWRAERRWLKVKPIPRGQSIPSHSGAAQGRRMEVKERRIGVIARRREIGQQRRSRRSAVQAVA